MKLLTPVLTSILARVSVLWLRGLWAQISRRLDSADRRLDDAVLALAGHDAVRNAGPIFVTLIAVPSTALWIFASDNPVIAVFSVYSVFTAGIASGVLHESFKMAKWAAS